MTGERDNPWDEEPSDGLDEATDPDEELPDPLRQSQELFHSLGEGADFRGAATGEMDAMERPQPAPASRDLPFTVSPDSGEYAHFPATAQPHPDALAAGFSSSPHSTDPEVLSLTAGTDPDVGLEHDIEEALAGFDLHDMEPLDEEELDVDDILEFDDLSGFIQEVDEEEELEDEGSNVDPFAASGMFVLGAEDEVEEDLTATLGAHDNEVVLDPLAMSGFELIEEHQADASHEALYPDEVVADDEIIFIDSGIYEIDEEALENADVDAVARRYVVEDTNPESSSNETPRVERQLRVGLEAMGSRFELRDPWARWATELRLEVLEERDPRKRGAYIYLFSTMLRLHGEAGRASASQLEEASQRELQLLRGPLLLRLAEVWDGALPRFVERLDALREADEEAGVDELEERHASIVVARIIEELFRGKPPAQLLERVGKDETIGALIIQAMFAHRRNDRVSAAGFWRQIARYLDGEEREQILTLAGYLTQEYSSFFERIDQDGGLGNMPRILLTSMQYGACWQGDHVLEARAIEWSLDLMTDADHASMSAALHRLAMLRSAMDKGGASQGDEGMAMEAALSATNAHPEELVHWLVLARHARTIGDLDTLADAYAAQIELIDDSTIRALVREQLASVLVSKGSDSEEEALTQLERALQDASDCLPALLSIGQERVQRKDWDGVMRLRAAPSVGESQSLNPAWRRADLLERVGGDVREILALYRSARHEHPESVHLFLSIERSLARLGQWRGLNNLFETTSRERPEFANLLRENGIDLDISRLAVEFYLEEVHTPALSQIEEYAASHGVVEVFDDENGERSPPRVIDEPILWKLVAARVHRKQWDEVEGLLQLAIEAGRARGLPELEARAQLWMVYLVGIKLKQPRRCESALRRIFEIAASPTLRRFAFHGLLRLGDEAWLAERLIADDDILNSLLDGLRTPESARDQIGVILGAELLQRGGEHARACDLLLEIDGVDDARRIFLKQRVLAFALRGRDWSRVHDLLGEDDIRHTLHAEPVRFQLNACFDRPRVPKDLDRADFELYGADPLLGVSLLEAALRTGSLHFARTLTAAMTRAFTASRSRFASFARILTVWLCEWSSVDMEETLEQVQEWSDVGMDGAGELEVLFMLSAWYRAARRLGRDEDADSIAETAREIFNDATVALFEQELPLNRNTPEEIATWYKERARASSGATKVYLQVSGAVIPWLLGYRDRNAARAIADAASAARDELHLVTFISVLAHREIAQHASAERYLSALVQQRDVLELAQWAGVRALFHLATTQNCPEDAVRQLQEAASASETAPWLVDFEELLVRSLRRREALESLFTLEAMGPGYALAARLERAELGNDHDDIVRLADQQVGAAMILAEVRAAHERKDWRQRTNLELRYAGLRKSLVNDSQDIIRLRFLDFVSEIEPAVFGSPWGPMRLIDDDLGRLGLPVKALEPLIEMVKGAQPGGMISALSLNLATQLLRLGRGELAYELFPETRSDDLVSRAWFWLGHMLLEECAPDEEAAVSLGEMLIQLCAKRAEDATGEVRAEILYEVARAAESSGARQRASRLYDEIVRVHPSFTPAEIASSRMLLLDRDWKGLAALWERALSSAESLNEQIGLSFRLGFVYERRLQEIPNALELALDAYARVVKLKDSHVPALHAMVRLAYQTRRFDVAADCLTQLIPLCLDRGLKAAYHLEVAALFEQELGAPQEALQHYLDAHFLEPQSHVSLYGTFRTDADGEREHAVDALGERLDVATAREAEELGDLLFLLCETSPRAEYLMRQRFSEHLVWRMVQFVDGVERGELHEEALAVVSSVVREPQLREIFLLIERSHTSGQHRQRAHHESYSREIGNRASGEGMLVSALSRAWRERDMESLATLSHLLARRSRGMLEMATEMTRASMMLRWLGTSVDALDLCERSLERVPDFLPAVKLARLVAAEIPNWPSVARWCTREADLTQVPSIAMRARVEASEVQRRHIGDLGAAIDQLRMVLSKDPQHHEVMENLKLLLVQAQRIPEALALCEKYLAPPQDREARLAQLNEMADLALNYAQPSEVSVRYLAASIALEPRQLRRLRILAELYDSLGQYQQALACYDAATRLSRDHRLVARMLLQMGHILEQQLGQLEQAGRVYQRIIELEPDNVASLQALVRVKRGAGDSIGALDGLARMEQLAKSPEELRRVRTTRLEVAEQGKLPTEVILNTARDLMIYHPTQLESADIIGEQLRGVGRAEEIEPLFRQILAESLRVHTTPPLGAYFALARRLQLNDLSYLLAGCGKWLRMASRDMLSFHETARMTERWPRESIPPELTAGVLPTDISVAFVEIIRRTQDGLIEACDPIPYSQYIKRRARLAQPSTPMQELAWRWPSIFGLELREVYGVDRLPLGSAIVWHDGGIRLLLDRSWERQDNSYQLLVRLGLQMAAWSMGIGYWSALGREAQISLFAETIAAVSPSWAAPPRPKFPSWFSREKWSRWLSRTGTDRVAPYALELASRMGPRAIPPQFLAIELAMERLACLILPDPGHSLTHTVRFGVENGPEHRPWTFVLSPSVAALRRALGIALP